MKLKIKPNHFLITQSNILITQIQNIKQIKNHHFILIDTKFNDLIHPTIYNNYHHINTLTTNNHSLKHTPTIKTIVAKPLYKSNDIFTQQKKKNIKTHTLPKIKTNNYLILHNTKTYNTSISSNYNNHPLLPKILFNNNQTQLIHHHQTIEKLLTLKLL